MSNNTGSLYAGKTVLVTGASRGVGLEITKHFIAHGATVLGISRGESEFKDAHYRHFSAELGDPDSIVQCFRTQISKEFKNIDVVINNAAVLTSQYAMIMPISNAKQMVNVNLLGVFFISREAAKLMRSGKGGRIINIGSMAVCLEPAGDSIYAATKVAIQTLANVMAKEFANMNVTCNTLSITAFESDMLRSHTPVAQEKIKEIIRNLTIPRMATSDDIMNVIDFFASERSSYITSQIIHLGGNH